MRKQRIEYDEFGVVLSNSNEDFQPFTYAGGLSDADTRLIRFGARDYDAQVGRWIAKDPIGFGGKSVNLYEYVINDPINFIDFTGFCKKPYWEQMIILLVLWVMRLNLLLGC